MVVFLAGLLKLRFSECWVLGHLPKLGPHCLVKHLGHVIINLLGSIIGVKYLD